VLVILLAAALSEVSRTTIEAALRRWRDYRKEQ
jgi:hypothetical protein